MATGLVVMSLGGHPLVARTGEIDRALRTARVEPTTVNRLTWPIGAGNHAEGTFIATRETVDELAAVSDRELDLVIGTIGQTVTIAGLRVLDVRPALVYGPEATPGLYLIDVVDERHNLRTRTAGANFNCTGSDRITLVESTADGSGETAAPRSYDDVLDILASFGGFDAFDYTHPETGRSPYEVRSYGKPVAPLIDELAGESGRVVVFPIDGTAPRVEHINARSSLEALDPVRTALVSGGVLFDIGAPSDGPLQYRTPDARTMAQQVPASVRVLFPTIGASEDVPEVLEVEAQFNADSALLEASDRVRVIADPFQVANAETQTTAEARAEDAAFDFYRRYRAGACDASFVGALDIQLGGSVQSLTWSQTPRGVFTRARADVEWSGYSYLRVDSTTFAGSGIQAAARSGGGVEVRAVDVIPNGVFAVDLVQVGGSQGSGTTPASWTYDVYRLGANQQSDDPLATSQAPRFPRQNPLMTSATTGLAFRDESGSVRLAIADEAPSFTLCEPCA